MITVIRTFNINPGKQAQAVAWLHEIAALGKAENGIETTISLPIGGNPNRIRATTRHENLAAMETRFAKLSTLPSYQELAAAGSEFISTESTFLEFWRDA
mgnify:CR=1 FL=1